MSKQTKHSRKTLKKVIRKIAYRGKMPIKKARGVLNHKPNLSNIKFILRCFSIVKFDVNLFHHNQSDARLIKIDGEVYIIVMSPVFTFVEKYSRTASEFICDWMKALPTKVEKTP